MVGIEDGAENPMQDDTIQLDQRATAALDVLKPSKRGEVMSEIYRLLDDPDNRRNVNKVPSSETHYVMDTPLGLRVFFRTDDDGRVVEILDLFRPSAWGVPDRDGERPDARP